MAVEEPTNWIIDLLYEEEKSDDLRLVGGESSKPEDLKPYQDLLGEIREVFDEDLNALEISEDTHLSILDAARQHAETQISKTVESTTHLSPPVVPRKPVDIPKRTPRTNDMQNRSTIWTKARFSTFAQISSVATVLIVGAFMVGQSGKIKSKFSVAEQAVVSDIRINNDNGAGYMVRDEQKLAQVVKPAPAKKEQSTRMGIGAPEDSQPEPEQNKQDTKTLAMLEQREAGFEKNTENVDEYFKEDLNAARSSARGRQNVQRKSRSKKSRSKKRPSTKSNSFPPDLFGDGGFADSSASSGPSLNKKGSTSNKIAPQYQAKDKLDDDLALAEAEAPSNSFDRNIAVPQKPRTYDNAPSSSAPVASSAPSAEPAEDQAQQTNYGSAAAADKADTTATQVAAAAPQAQSKTEAKKAAPMPTINGIERAYKSNRFDETLTEAERFLDTGQGSNFDKARALELKARAYQKLGQGTKASAIYRQIEKDYPSYYKKKNLKQPVKRSKRKARKIELDSASEMEIAH